MSHVFTALDPEIRWGERGRNSLRVHELRSALAAQCALGKEEDNEDWVQTRILWLEGLDPENANTKDRYIYIHGTNAESQLGTPASHGCVRMSNDDVADFYTRVEVGTPMIIEA